VATGAEAEVEEEEEEEEGLYALEAAAGAEANAGVDDDDDDELLATPALAAMLLACFALISLILSCTISAVRASDGGRPLATAFLRAFPAALSISTLEAYSAMRVLN
jgi:hypothetical protein